MVSQAKDQDHLVGKNFNKLEQNLKNLTRFYSPIEPTSAPLTPPEAASEDPLI